MRPNTLPSVLTCFLTSGALSFSPRRCRGSLVGRCLPVFNTKSGESANAVPHYHKLCSRDSHIWGILAGQQSTESIISAKAHAYAHTFLHEGKQAEPSISLSSTTEPALSNGQGLPKICITHEHPSPRKTLVKGERLIRHEERPE